MVIIQQRPPSDHVVCPPTDHEVSHCPWTRLYIVSGPGPSGDGSPFGTLMAMTVAGAL